MIYCFRAQAGVYMFIEHDFGKNRSLFHNIKDSEIFSVKSTSYFLSLEKKNVQSQI